MLLITGAVYANAQIPTSDQSPFAANRLEIRYARDLRPEDLRSETVVLIGATEANPRVELFEQNMNFVFSHDRSHRVMSVINRSPKGDEPNRWDSGYTDAQRRAYGVVAYLPNLSGVEMCSS